MDLCCSKILNQNGKNDLDVNANDPYFQYKPKVSKGACWCKFGDPSSNPDDYGYELRYVIRMTSCIDQKSSGWLT